MIQDRSRIITVEIEDELKRAYMEYSMSVIVSRALPDIRDGLKPSQRRIIYAMSELNLTPDKGFRKCAKIAGDTSGNYHPHGEQVVYPTLVRMAQPWNMRYPLVNGQGNFGSIDGDPPAAMRYTEAKMEKITLEMLADLDKDTVDFKKNYDETREEPSVFPSKIPNLLVNGCSGIAVGMATSIPPHNLTEVSDALIEYIENPDITPLKIMDFIKGPDFPTGGYIIGKSGILDYFQTGYGKVKVRGKASIETKSNGSEAIIISEIPYQVNKTLMIEKMVNLVKEKRIEEISDIRDESGRDGMRLVIELKKRENADVVLNKLYKYTQLQETFGIINLALVNGVPTVLGIKEMLSNFIEFRQIVITRRIQYLLKNAKERIHILEGYRIALDNIDEIIQLIKASGSPAEASIQMQEKFILTEIQAKAILDMKLQKLTGLEREKIENEYNELLKKIDYYNKVLNDVNLRLDIIKQEITEIRNNFGNERRTVITEHVGDFNVEDLIAEEDVVVTITHEGYIKRIPLNIYKQQRRGGKGSGKTSLKETDFVQSIFVASTHSYILFFTNFGKCYWLKVYEIPESTNKGWKGKAIVNLLQAIEPDEKIKTFVIVNNFDMNHFLVMATMNGIVKKTPLMDYSRPRSRGIIAIKLTENDELVEAQITEGVNDIVLATRNGYSNRFSEEEIRISGRNSQGVKGIDLRDTDRVVSMVVIKRQGTLLAITENGYGKRTLVDSYSRTRRKTKGVITIKTTQRNGHLISLMEVVDNDDLMVVTKDGRILRVAVQGISTIGRNTQGIRILDLQEDNKVIDIARVPKVEEENDEPEGIDNFDPAVHPEITEIPNNESETD